MRLGRAGAGLIKVDKKNGELAGLSCSICNSSTITMAKERIGKSATLKRTKL